MRQCFRNSKHWKRLCTCRMTPKYICESHMRSFRSCPRHTKKVPREQAMSKARNIPPLSRMKCSAVTKATRRETSSLKSVRLFNKTIASMLWLAFGVEEHQSLPHDSLCILSVIIYFYARPKTSTQGRYESVSSRLKPHLQGRMTELEHDASPVVWF